MVNESILCSIAACWGVLICQKGPRPFGAHPSGGALGRAFVPHEVALRSRGQVWQSRPGRPWPESQAGFRGLAKNLFASAIWDASVRAPLQWIGAQAPLIRAEAS